MTTDLAIDDSRTTREILGLMHRSARIEIHPPEGRLHGLKLHQKRTPEAILTDINMPQLDCFGVIEATHDRQASHTVSILVLSTERTEGRKMCTGAARASGWRAKPVDPTKLIRAVQRVMR